MKSRSNSDNYIEFKTMIPLRFTICSAIVHVFAHLCEQMSVCVSVCVCVCVCASMHACVCLCAGRVGGARV